LVLEKSPDTVHLEQRKFIKPLTMKQFIQFLFLTFILLIQISCSKDSELILPIKESNIDLSGPIDPADSDLLNQVLIFPDGGQRINGSVPTTIGNNQTPIINTNSNEAITSNGSTLLINFGYQNASSNISGCYVQVDGAGSYYSIPYDSNSGASGTIQLPIGVPTNVIGGSFCVNYCIYDSNDYISNVLSICISVLELGSGNLQISLAWDTPTDQDLYVKDPSGTTIYYSNTSSSTGGQLDRDDVDGFGPENIFWASVAPDGEYEVLVDDFSDSPSINNFTITISTPDTRREFSGSTINGSMPSVCTFRKEGDQLFF